MIDVPQSFSTEARSINGAGVIVVNSSDGMESRSALWEAGVLSPVPGPLDDRIPVAVSAINNHGQLVGGLGLPLGGGFLAWPTAPTTAISQR
jgi:hypothetical protein